MDKKKLKELKIDLGLFEEKWKARIKKGKWGNWRLEPDAGLLVIRKSLRGSPRVTYEIPFDRCNTSAEILDWIGQVNQKKWISRADVGYLVEALDDIFGLQATFCSGGKEQSDGSRDFAKRKFEGIRKTIYGTRNR